MGCLGDAEPELARVLALGIIVHLSASVRNRRAILKDDKVRKTLVNLLFKETVQDSVKQKGFLALISLALAAFSPDCYDRCSDVQQALGLFADRSYDTEQRVTALRALWSAAATMQKPEKFWQVEQIRNALLNGTSSDEEMAVREKAMAICSALAAQRGGPDMLWTNETFRMNMFEAAQSGEATSVRAAALSTLAGICREPELRYSIWFFVIEDEAEKHQRLTDEERARLKAANEGVSFNKTLADSLNPDKIDEQEAEGAGQIRTMRKVILDASAAGEKVGHRLPALKACVELGFEEELRLTMVNRGLIDLLLEASQDQRFPQKELRAIELGYHRLNDWNEARLAEELRVEREGEERERNDMLWEEEYQIRLREVPEMIQADEESYVFEEWMKQQREKADMAAEDERCHRFYKDEWLAMVRDTHAMQEEDAMSKLMRDKERAAIWAAKVKKAEKAATAAASEAAEKSIAGGGDPSDQAAAAGAAAAVAARSAKMPPDLQAAFAGKEAARVGKNAMPPMKPSQRTEAASQAAITAGKRADMTLKELAAASGAAAGEAVAAESEPPRVQAATSGDYAARTAQLLGMSPEERATAAGAAAATTAGVAGLTPEEQAMEAAKAALLAGGLAFMRAGELTAAVVAAFAAATATEAAVAGHDAAEQARIAGATAAKAGSEPRATLPVEEEDAALQGAMKELETMSGEQCMDAAVSAAIAAGKLSGMSPEQLTTAAGLAAAAAAAEGSTEFEKAAIASAKTASTAADLEFPVEEQVAFAGSIAEAYLMSVDGVTEEDLWNSMIDAATAAGGLGGMLLGQLQESMADTIADKAAASAGRAGKTVLKQALAAGAAAAATTMRVVAHYRPAPGQEQKAVAEETPAEQPELSSEAQPGDEEARAGESGEAEEPEEQGVVFTAEQQQQIDAASKVSQRVGTDLGMGPEQLAALAGDMVDSTVSEWGLEEVPRAMLAGTSAAGIAAGLGLDAAQQASAAGAAAARAARKAGISPEEQPLVAADAAETAGLAAGMTEEEAEAAGKSVEEEVTAKVEALAMEEGEEEEEAAVDEPVEVDAMDGHRPALPAQHSGGAVTESGYPPGA